MQIDLFRHEDFGEFLGLAGTEGWICDRWEFDFLLHTFPHGCFVAREGGIPLGFVTSIKYGVSGWIGNLIVRQESRGKGIGKMLMKKALEVLVASGTESVWLTASLSGRPIYEGLDFVAVDVVNRWVGTGTGGKAAARDGFSRSDMLAIDHAGWGDRRDSVIDTVAARGNVLAMQGAFLVTQRSAHGLQLGPWGGGDTSAALLLDAALAEAGAGKKVFLDVPARNAAQSTLLPKTGFSIRGSNVLMCRGEASGYRPENIFALATMGSMG